MKSHLMSHTRIHNIWLSMRQRCEKPNCSGWKKYGAKGIRVCKEWSSFEPFRDWAFANGYDEHLTLDRIDPLGNYEPSNCRWVSQKVQQNNRSNNIYITYNGERKKLEDWATETGMSRQVLYHRYKRGWSAERIIQQPRRKKPTKRTDSKRHPESSIVIRFDEDDMSAIAAIECSALMNVCFGEIEPYGKTSGVETSIQGRKAFVYRNPSGYVIDFRSTVYDDTGEFNSSYLRKGVRRTEVELEKERCG